MGGNVAAFEHILEVAYGRRGRLRWEIMKVGSSLVGLWGICSLNLCCQPLLSDPNAPPAPRIIPAYERSRPPVYSPELVALLTSTHSRTTKALQARLLKSPPTMPLRADPSSEEARLLGPFSKRREVNLRWRYFTEECQKVLPPLQLSVKEISASFEVTKESSDRHELAAAGVRNVGLQGGCLLEEAQSLAGPAWKPLSIPRRARKGPQVQIPDSRPFTSKLSTRWLRKRYQNLLGKIPVLTYSYPKRQNDGEGGHSGRYEITLTPNAISSQVRYGASRLPPVDESSLSWIRLAEGDKESKTKSVKQTNAG